MRHLCIHGHFYQPARENPWTGVVEMQDGATPYHDWNARITAECYARNAASRILDGAGRIVRIVNNYAGISFDAGPTLLRWLAAEAPSTYELLLDGDRASRREQYGHGGAVAQVYNHMIMPLATPRDRSTQVRWGVRDFERRFRRRPEGMWLPETAVDLATLEDLADLGIGFTILAPHQARRVRQTDGSWAAVTADSLDTSMPYRCRLPSGRWISLFFYHGPLSRAVAFEGLLESGAGFADRLAGTLPDQDTLPRLVLVASDGEMYGHHHALGDMVLADALDRLSRTDGVRLTNCAAYLAAHPPTVEVEIAEDTSWSCVHGVERWQRDCGCGRHRATQQRWRAPVREAITRLADELGTLFERRGSEIFRDPWAARDEAIDLVDSADGAADGFLRRHGVRSGGGHRGTALVLLEMQRQALLMQSSDGWFFDDVAGVETVQILSHAGRAIELAGTLAPDPTASSRLEEEFLAHLRRAPGNTERFPHGAAVYQALVRPRMVAPARAVAIYAMTAMFDAPSPTLSREMTVSPVDRATAASGGHALAVGRAHVRHRLTADEASVAFAVAHFGGHQVQCAVAAGWPEERYADVRAGLLDRLARDVLSEVVRSIDAAFGPQGLTLSDLPVEDRRAVLDRIARPTLDRLVDAYRRLYDETRPLMEYLRAAAVPIPGPFLTAAVVVLTRDLEQILREAPDAPLPARAHDLLRELHGWERRLHAERFEPLLRERLERALAVKPADEAAARAIEVLDLAEAAGLTLNLREAQNRFVRLTKAGRPASLRDLGTRLHFVVDNR